MLCTKNFNGYSLLGFINKIPPVFWGDFIILRHIVILYLRSLESRQRFWCRDVR